MVGDIRSSWLLLPIGDIRSLIRVCSRKSKRKQKNCQKTPTFTIYCRFGIKLFSISFKIQDTTPQCLQDLCQISRPGTNFHFFLIIRPDQEKAIKKILCVLRALAVQDQVTYFIPINSVLTFLPMLSKEIIYSPDPRVS